MRRTTSTGRIIFAVLVGILIGTAIGEVLGLVLPDGVVRQFFLRNIHFGFSPTTIDLALLTITFGLSIKLNIIGVIGVFLSAYILRWYS